MKSMNGIKFLGTAGARHAVTRQLRASGGIWYSLDGTQVLVDPGPGSLVRALSSRPKLEPSALDGILLSHRHIDHTTDVNIMIEAMTFGGTKRRGTLLAPRDALEDDPVVLRYLRNYLEGIHTISEGAKFSIGEISIEFPVRNPHHSVETYGYRVHWSGGTICHIVDTRYFAELSGAYPGNVLILNVLLHDPDDQAIAFIDHLNINNARTLIGDIRPDKAILTHFGLKMLRAKPKQVADSIAKETGVEVIAAYDGMTYRL
jgi:phosphoribosyl 1,2-cyclic phosphodiesterase